MRFTIITPSFNQEKFIGKTIQSVFNQKGDFEIEYIIMDGGSTDGTLEIIKKYEREARKKPWIKFIWQSKKDKGQTDAINQGLKMATGEVVAYLNSDDTYHPGTLQKIKEVFDTHPNTLWVTGYCNIINEEGSQILKWITLYKNFLLRNYSYNKLLITNFISQPVTFWRRSILEEIGYFDENLNYTMDHDFWLRLGSRSDPKIITEYLGTFRLHTSSKSYLFSSKQLREDFEVAKRHSKNSSILILGLHWLYNKIIILIYLIIK